MNSLRRMLDVMDLITPDRPVVTVEEICELLGYAPASAYRYVRELAGAGYLVRLPTGYALGPRIIELDLQMRENDPLLTQSRNLVEGIAEKTGLSVLISELYEEKVVAVFQEHAPNENITFGRGRSMPLFRGATTRVIMAHLMPKRLRRLYDKHAESPDAIAIGADWRSFSRAMLEIRKAGYCLSKGELDNKNAGIAAPILDGNNRVFGAVTIVGTIDRFSAFNDSFLVSTVKTAAETISTFIRGDVSSRQEKTSSK
ncbi:MAG: IclR family transcriptional regulator [Alphaproteobacteria bacterium]|nr:IclR family transcriptional regulator [Alphaproteobacteria bacterium]